MQNPTLLRVEPEDPEESAIQKAVSLLMDGGLVVFPTETVYGLACRADSGDAMDRVYEAKGRETGKPLAFFVSNPAVIEEMTGELDLVAKRLAEQYWPGPLTLVLKDGDGYSGFRIPDHQVPQRILQGIRMPIAVTSANRSGKTDSRDAESALYSLGRAVDLILDGGPVREGVASTVVKVCDGTVEILRSGAIPDRDIERVARG